MADHGTVSLSELSADDCRAFLTLASVGRIGISVNALPVILPVNYVVHNGDVVFRASSGTKLAAATAGAIVAFEVDHYELDGTSGWSVLLQGRAHEIDDPGEMAEVRELPLRSWALDGSASHYVRIRTGTISGRRFQSLGLEELTNESVS